ncbi:MAG: glycosyltransferase family 2 protein [Deltaproteobacteria bacterium]|nr:glycosyltransferase family 2 protein [Deltaproteobacteria bacterium]
MIDLSIVIVSYETRDITLECLDAIDRELRARQDAGGLVTETIVVDNASSDGSAQAIAARHPWVKGITLPSNVGFARGCNAGLREAAGRHAVLLNSDTIVRRGALERCVEFLDAHCDVGVVGPQLLHADGRRQNSVHSAPGVLTELVPRGVLEMLLPRSFPSKRRRIAAPVDVDAVLGACLVVRRDVWQKLGGLPEEYFMFLEETDWCWSIRDAGWRIVHLPDVELVHLSGASSARRDALRKRIEYHRSLYRFLAKRRGTVAVCVVRAQRIVKGAVGLVLGAPLACISGSQRRRWRERAGLLSWHLRGCPDGEGLAPAAGAQEAS